MENLFQNKLVEFATNQSKRTISLLGFFALIMFIVLSIIDQPLQNLDTPNGIVSFELAGNLSASSKILNSWNNSAKLFASLSLGIDYLFLVLYSFFFFVVIVKTSEYFKNHFKLFSKIGIYLALFQLIAALFDAIENYFLIQLLFGSVNETFPINAFWFASIKFLIIILGVVYLIFGLLLFFFKKRKATNRLIILANSWLLFVNLFSLNHLL